MRKILEGIQGHILRNPSDTGAYEDMLWACSEALVGDKALALQYITSMTTQIEHAIMQMSDVATMGKLDDLCKRALKIGARDDFDCFLQYVEWKRDPDKKFYRPRRKVLRPVVQALQDLADGELELLAISMPPGVGKTTLAIFFLCWMAGRVPNEPMLTGSHSNSFVRGVYDECLRIFDPNGEYLWRDVFPDIKIASTNAKDCRIDLDRSQRFETLEFTSLGTGNAGLYRASTLLYCDDLVSGLEVAMSKERLDKLWALYTNDLRQRKIGNHCRELHIATRWSVHDVIGRLEREYGNSGKARFIVMPALNAEDESNFDYQYGVGFTTEFYHEQRNIMDDVGWRALYMNQPIEREGQLYAPEELRRFFSLPDAEPDAILSVCDTKAGGSDFCVMPIAYKYGNDYYIEDAICDNGKPEIIDARLVEILVRHNVHMSRFESNVAGSKIAEKVQKEVKAKGGRTKLTTKYTTANKETKIIVQSPWVKEHCLFRDESAVPSREYRKMLDFLCGYTMAGKNKHDDVPDAFAQLAEFAQSLGSNSIEVIQRPW